MSGVGIGNAPCREETTRSKFFTRSLSSIYQPGEFSNGGKVTRIVLWTESGRHSWSGGRESAKDVSLFSPRPLSKALLGRRHAHGTPGRQFLPIPVNEYVCYVSPGVPRVARELGIRGTISGSRVRRPTRLVLDANRSKPLPTRFTACGLSTTRYSEKLVRRNDSSVQGARVSVFDHEADSRRTYAVVLAFWRMPKERKASFLAVLLFRKKSRLCYRSPATPHCLARGEASTGDCVRPTTPTTVKWAGQLPSTNTPFTWTPDLGSTRGHTRA